jgi:hypothetical protein
LDILSTTLRLPGLIALAKSPDAAESGGGAHSCTLQT